MCIQTLLHNFATTSTTQMTVNSQGREARTSLYTTRLLDVVNHPLGPERTLDALMAFTSTKSYVEVVRRLNEEEAAKLVDVFDQVCRGFRDTLTHLTTAMVPLPRSSDPSIGGRLKERRCYAHSALSAAPRLNSHTRRFYPMD